jgi:hypothetical protein
MLTSLFYCVARINIKELGVVMLRKIRKIIQNLDSGLGMAIKFIFMGTRLYHLCFDGENPN